MAKFNRKHVNKSKKAAVRKRDIAKKKEQELEGNVDQEELSRREQHKAQVAQRRELQKEIKTLKQERSKLKKSAANYQRRKYLTNRLKELRNEAKLQRGESVEATYGDGDLF